MAAAEEKTSCLDLEDIAAYLDDLLAPADRPRVIRHLAECPACFEAYAGALRFMLDERAELGEDGERAESAEPLPFDRPPARIATPDSPAIGPRHDPLRDPGNAARPRGRRGRWRWIAAAVAAVLAAALGLWLVRWTSDPERAFSSSGLLADLAQGGAPTAAIPSKDHVTRGGNDDANILLDEQSFFRLGVGQLDLALTLRFDRESVDSALLRLIDVSSKINLGEATKKEYEAIRRDAQAGADSGALAARAGEIEERTRDFDELAPYVALGRWTEACRVAAPKVRTSLLTSSATARLLDEILEADAANQPPAAANPATPGPPASAGNPSSPAPAEDAALAGSSFDAASTTLEELHKTLVTLRQDIAAGRLDQAAKGCTNLLDGLGSD
jgi:hypothetical protein